MAQAPTRPTTAPVPGAPPAPEPVAAVPSPVIATDSPEFQAAVAKAAADAVREMLAATKSPTAGVDDATTAMLRQLALSIAEVSDQGTQRKRVAPEILEQRRIARDKMIDRITLARENKEKPEYTAISKLYLNERLIQPFVQDPNTKKAVPVTFTWTGEPSDGMRPANAVAREIYALFRESRGSVEKVKGTDNRPYWMTPAGLVVKGDPPPKREMAIAGAVFDADLEVAGEEQAHNQNDPNAEFVHVLGTIADPARQNYQGKVN